MEIKGGLEGSEGQVLSKLCFLLLVNFTYGSKTYSCRDLSHALYLLNQRAEGGFLFQVIQNVEKIGECYTQTLLFH